MEKETTLKEYFRNGGNIGRIEIWLNFEQVSSNNTTYDKLVEECDSFLKELIEKYNGWYYD